MNRKVIFIGAVLVSIGFAGGVFAADTQTMKAQSSKKEAPAAARKNKAAVRDAKKVQTTGEDSGKQRDAGKSTSAISKEQHETARKIIDNLK